MKISSALRKYCNKRIEAIDTLLKKPQQLFLPEDYHQLRVEIKKAKALFAVTEFCTDRFKSKEFYHLLKPLFKKAGRVRDLQLEIQELDNYKLTGPFPSYAEWLEEERDKAAVDFFSSIDDGLRKDINASRKSIAHFLAHVHKNEVDNFIESRKEKIINLITKRSKSDEQVHSMRKMLKEFFYTKKMITSTDLPVTNTDELQDTLGKWHDQQVMATHLQQGMETGKLQIKEKQRIGSLKTMVTKRKDSLLAKINEIKPVFLQSFRIQS